MLNVQDELAIHEYLHVKFGHKKHKDRQRLFENM